MNGENQGSRGIWEWQIVTYSILSLLGFICAVLFYKGFTEEAVRILIRNTARFSFLFFILAFSADALHKWLRTSASWWLRMNRKFLGISFALVHLIHLATIVVLQLFFHKVFNQADITSIVGGGMAYFFVIAMLFTSFDGPKEWLSKKQWSALHTLGGYWIWAVFLSTYYKRTDEPIYWIFVALLLMVIVLRIHRFRLSR